VDTPNWTGQVKSRQFQSDYIGTRTADVSGGDPTAQVTARQVPCDTDCSLTHHVPVIGGHLAALICSEDSSCLWSRGQSRKCG